MITIDYSRLNLRSGHAILDIGCGEGRHTAGAWSTPGTFCVGADMNPKDLKTAQAKLRLHQTWTGDNGSAWCLSAADITRLPFADNSFDSIICSEVMEHIPCQDKALSELARVLKPGCRLALSVPRHWPEAVCWRLSNEYHNANQGHIRIYRKKELINRIAAHGLRPSGSHHYAHSLHTPYWWLKCLVGPSRTDSPVVNLYHRLLVWDLMKQPFFTQWLDRILNPILGKSLVLYFVKD